MPPTPEQQRRRGIQRTNREVMDEHGVDVGSFKKHWERIENGRLSIPQTINAAKFGRLCWIVANMGKEGLTMDLVKKAWLKKILNVSDRGGEEEWRRRAQRKLGKCHRRMVKLKVREGVRQRDDRSGDEPISDSDDPPPLLTSMDDLSRYRNITTVRNFLGPTNMATGVEDAMRPPRDETGQELLQFADGFKLYPSFLLTLSELERYNLALPVQLFEQAGVIAHIPTSFPTAQRVVVVGRLKSLDLRVKPSGMRPFQGLKKAYDRGGDVEIADLMQVLCISHYRIAEKGVFAFAHRQLARLGLLPVLDYDFNWTAHQKGSKIMVDEWPAPPLADNRQGAMKITFASVSSRKS